MVGVTRELIWELVEDLDAAEIAVEVVEDDTKESAEYIDYLNVRLDDLESFSRSLYEAFWMAPAQSTEHRNRIGVLIDEVDEQVRGVKRVLGHLMVEHGKTLLASVPSDDTIDADPYGW